MYSLHTFPKLDELTQDQTHQLRLRALRRPKLLFAAVAAGLGSYNRTAILKRLSLAGLGQDRLIERLFELEQQLERCRKSQTTPYRPARHIEVLVALCAEITPQNTQKLRQ